MNFKIIFMKIKSALFCHKSSITGKQVHNEKTHGIEMEIKVFSRQGIESLSFVPAHTLINTRCYELLCSALGCSDTAEEIEAKHTLNRALYAEKFWR